MASVLAGITRNDGAVRKQGSGVLWGAEVVSTGEDPSVGTPTAGGLTAADTYWKFGRAQKSVYNRSVTVSKEADQGGDKIETGTETDTTFEYTIMQRDKEHIILPKTADGAYIRFIQELTNKKLNGKMQFLIVPCAKIEPGMQLDGTDMYVKHKYNCLPYSGSSALTVTLTGLVSSIGAVDTLTATVNTGDYEVVVDYTPA